MTSIIALLAVTGVVTALSSLFASFEIPEEYKTADTDPEAEPEPETRLQGGDSDDILRLAADLERIDGGEGDDLILGGPDADTLGGGPDDDLLVGGPGADVLKGGVQHDILMGVGDPAALDDATIAAASETGTLDPSLFDGLLAEPDTSGADTLEGGYGRDLLVMGPGDTAEGGDQADSFAYLDAPVPGDNMPAPAEITDFDPAREELVLPYDPAGPAPGAAIETAGDDAIVTIDGTPKIVLRGMGGQLTADHLVQAPFVPGL